MRPGYTIVATLTLALGIGNSTVVFSVIDAAAFRPLPYAEPDRLVQLWERSLQDPEIDRWPVAPATYRDWHAMMRSYTDLAAYDYSSAVLTDEQSAQVPRGSSPVLRRLQNRQSNRSAPRVARSPFVETNRKGGADRERLASPSASG